MKIVSRKDLKREKWDQFCVNNSQAWFQHTWEWIEYILHYKPLLKSKDMSFAVMEKDSCIAIVPLTLDTYENQNQTIREFSFAGDGTPCPATKPEISYKARESIIDSIFEYVDGLAIRNDVKRSIFCKYILAQDLNQALNNSFMKYGYIDSSLNTLVIDLNKSEGVLWNEIRRNHKRNILKMESLHTEILTADNIKKEDFYAYKEMHHKAAGYKTRPDITFEMMLQWIFLGRAFLAVIKKDGQALGFEFFVLFNGKVWGQSAANDPDFGRLPIRHKLEWEAMLWMKKRGYRFYEIGRQQYGALPYDFPDKKVRDITLFKNGFGGKVYPWFRGEKYYSKRYYLEVSQQRNKLFLENYEFLNDKPEVKESVVGTKVEIDQQDYEKVINETLNECQGLVNQLSSNPKALNFILGKIKGKLKSNYNYCAVKAILLPKICSSVPL